ncbi:MAG TPA: hypothetical protein VM074_07975 [Solimonas sp.]|nr:hypothetical protein [Solimonas sp.]
MKFQPSPLLRGLLLSMIAAATCACSTFAESPAPPTKQRPRLVAVCSLEAQANECGVRRDATVAHP